jgi:hypothetical protein
VKVFRTNTYLMPLLVVLAWLGCVWVAKAAGLWQTSGRDQVLLDKNGQPDPAGSKGWMTLTYVSDTYGVPLDALYVMIGADTSVPPATALKDLEKLVPGMEVWAIREGVAVYQGGSWTPADGRYRSGEGAPAAIEPMATPSPEPTPLPTPVSKEEHVPQGLGGGTGEGCGEGGGQKFWSPRTANLILYRARRSRAG